MLLGGLFKLVHVILADCTFHPFPDGFTGFCIFCPLISFFLFQLAYLFQQFECFLRIVFYFAVCLFPCYRNCTLCDGVRDVFVAP